MSTKHTDERVTNEREVQQGGGDSWQPEQQEDDEHDGHERANKQETITSMVRHHARCLLGASQLAHDADGKMAVAVAAACARAVAAACRTHLLRAESTRAQGRPH